MRLVLLGPPGAGKGTQAMHIAAAFGVPRIATGDIFRANVRDGHAAGHSQAQEYMDSPASWSPTRSSSAWSPTGWRSPTPLMGFLLDGFPRTVVQADWPGRTTCARPARQLDTVLHFNGPRRRAPVARIAIAQGGRGGAQTDDAATFLRRMDEYRAEDQRLEYFY